MENVRVNKADLLKRIKANRRAHRKVYEKAYEAFSAQAAEELSRRLELIKAGKHFDLSIRLPIPEDHTADYDRAITMIEMSLGETIVLSERDFAEYVQDDWDWKRAWAVTAAAYLPEPG